MALASLRLGSRLVPTLLSEVASEAAILGGGSVLRSSWYGASSARPALRNFIHTSPASRNLVSILTEELSHEEQSSTSDPESGHALKNVFEGWSLKESPLQSAMTLTCTGPQGEAISVEADANGQEDPVPEEDEEGEAAMVYPMRFVVNVAKGDKKLQFECLFIEDDEGGPQIEHIAYLPANADEATIYTGPNFGELDEKLQEEFSKYLNDRGITANFAQYVCQLLHDKEQKEYVGWLRNVKTFMS
eukprot:TRINITY_DN8653_c0_g1_i2.p1 TRINITY_DN8653_c0_g1~~TRINITY_DN8653_c0_g1_i2.p1  ORF type:complete len:246 (-),score=39.58 TRINITY_DN8653_c0_g1_i2:255-992(-)